jgi:magnesium transporter
MLDLELKLLRRYLSSHPAEAARELEKLPRHEAATILADQTAELAAGLALRMRWASAAECFGRMDPASAAAVLCRLPPSTSSTLMRRLTLKTRRAIFDAMPHHWREPVEHSLRYPEGSVGAMMDAAPRELPESITAGEALELLARESAPRDSEFFVIDSERRLYGFAAIGDLLHADRDAPLEKFCHRGVGSLDPVLPAAAAAEARIWMDVDIAPVVDNQGRLVGAVRHRRLREYLEGERSGEGSKAADAAYAFGEVCWNGLAAAIGVLAGVGSATLRPQPPHQPGNAQS